MSDAAERLPDEAVALLEHGLALLPMNGKRPVIRWEHRPATPPTVDEIEQWWPGAGVGVLLGDDLAVIDVDEHDISGSDALHDLERRYEPLPDTWRSLTPSGGAHVWFTVPDGVALEPAVLVPGVELRTGRQVVACPPEHGRSWETAPDETPLAQLPHWIVQAAVKAKRKRRRSTEPGEPIPEGRRNDELASLAGTMRRRGMSAAEIAAALLVVNRERCKPPLPERDVDTIAASVARYQPAEEADGEADPAQPEVLRSELAQLLKLADHRIGVLAIHLVGNGPAGALHIDLSNGITLEAERFGDLWTHTGLAKFVTQGTGVNAGSITKGDANQANALIRQLAAVKQGRTLADLGRDHGYEFLHRAPVHDFQLTDQGDRYRAFARLDALDPVAQREVNRAVRIAAESLVLHDTQTEIRYVHCGHLLADVRARGEVSSPVDLAKRMELAGWSRRGKRGDMKATSARTGATVRLRLWWVPAGWEDS